MPNATTGTNTVVRSCVKSMKPGDSIVTLNTAYGLINFANMNASSRIRAALYIHSSQYMYLLSGSLNAKHAGLICVSVWVGGGGRGCIRICSVLPHPHTHTHTRLFTKIFHERLWRTPLFYSYKFPFHTEKKKKSLICFTRFFCVYYIYISV